MKKPILYRKEIPFFHQKTAVEYQKDPYERYDPMVIRQLMLHLCDLQWGNYPFHTILDFARNFYPNNASNILELGCSVGRWIAELAEAYPQSTCWGIDYSYQMLKTAHDYWVKGKTITIDGCSKGFSHTIDLQASPQNNLHFGLSKASVLPFDNNSQDLIVSSFLLDRLPDPLAGLQEMYRVLKPKQSLILVTPLNFSNAAHWQQFYPPKQLKTVLLNIGFEIIEWNTTLSVCEPLDIHKNVIHWNCIGAVLQKGNSH